MTQEEYLAIERGRQARDILDSEIVKEAFDVLERKLFDAFKAAPARDTEGREYIHKMSKVLKDFRAYFDEAVLDGENAAAIIREREREARFKEYPGAAEVHRS